MAYILYFQFLYIHIYIAYRMSDRYEGVSSNDCLPWRREPYWTTGWERNDLVEPSTFS